MSNKIVIRNEEDAWLWLKRATDNNVDFNEPLDLVFEGWPVLNLHFTGNDFDSSVPTRIMPPLLEAQKEINRLYCQLRYGEQSLRKLTDEDRSRLELVVKVSPGSSHYDTNLTKTLNETIKSAVDNMDSKHIMISVIAAGLMWTSSVAWKDWVNQQSKQAELEMRVEMSKLETERLQLVADIHKQIPEVKETSKGINEFRNSSLNKMKATDSFTLPNSQTEVSGEFAKEITSKPKVLSTEERIDGEFLIMSVISGDTSGYKVKVKRVSDGKLINVTIPQNHITLEQQDVLKNAEWSKQPVELAINANVLRGEVTRARIISVESATQATDAPTAK